MAGARDLRIDFFRGLALMMIFINHIPGNIYSNLTLAAVGLADAAELFVFLAGVSCWFAFGRPLLSGEVMRGLLSLYGRVWQLYVAHLTMFVVVLGICAYAALAFSDDTYLESMGFDVFVAQPTQAVLRALSLTFQPNYLDILPLYIVLLAAVPLMLLLLRVHAALLLALSLALYLLAVARGWNLPNFQAANVWFFNPFAWQFLFATGLVTGRVMDRGLQAGRWRHALTALAALYVLLAFMLAAPWARWPGLEDALIISFSDLPPISKTDLSPWRLLDILAKVWLVGQLVAPQAAFFETRFGRMMRRAGKHSLDVFALGIVLSMAATVVARETAFALGPMTAINVAGVAVMLLVAQFLDWREETMRRPRRSDPPVVTGVAIGTSSPSQAPP